MKNFIYCDISEKNIIESKKRCDEIIKSSQEFKNKINSRLPINIFPLLLNQEKWPFKENSIDCVINNLYFHHLDNFEEHFKAINKSLRPDGCLLGNILTESTLKELKCILTMAESEREGGVSSNVLGFPAMSDIGNLLQRLKFTLPSLNVNKCHFLFHDLSYLFEFLEKIGETNFMKNRRMYKKRETFIAAMALYQNLFNKQTQNEDKFFDIRIEKINLLEEKENEYIYATIDIATFICWKYHESQPLPKERGSAEFSLKEIAIDSLDKDVRYGKIFLKPGTEDEYEIIEMTEIIKDKIRKKLGDEVIEEKLKNFTPKK